jgi:NAD(P)-dependent dehydrogenase (short-subunit alcohol dehydrogenase family)
MANKHTIKESSQDEARLTGTVRVVALSDGVFAITITLLVLEIHRPEDYEPGGLLHALLQQWPSYLAYAMLVVGRELSRPSRDGNEITLQTNYLAAVALTESALDLMRQPRPSRIVNVASATHLSATLHLDDLNLERHPYSPVIAYSQSKLALVTYTCWLAERRTSSMPPRPPMGTVPTSTSRASPGPTRTRSTRRFRSDSTGSPRT